MFNILNQLLNLSRFIRWLVPENGRTLRLYLSLLNVLVYSRYSVYQHFREFSTSDNRGQFGEFFISLASIPDLGKASVPATLLTRLLRTIYLTGAAGRNGTVNIAGPNQGYLDHSCFSYGNDLERICGENPTASLR